MIDLEPSEVHPNLSTERSHLTLGESSRRSVRTWRDSFDLLRFRIRFQSSRIKKSWFLYGHSEVHRQSTSPSGHEQLTCWDQDFTCCLSVRLERDTSSPRSMATRASRRRSLASHHPISTQLRFKETSEDGECQRSHLKDAQFQLYRVSRKYIPRVIRRLQVKTFDVARYHNHTCGHLSNPTRVMSLVDISRQPLGFASSQMPLSGLPIGCHHSHFINSCLLLVERRSFSCLAEIRTRTAFTTIIASISQSLRAAPLNQFLWCGSQ